MNPDEPETIYTSNANEPEQLAADLKTVVDRIIENRKIMIPMSRTNNPLLYIAKKINEARICNPCY